MTAALWLYLVSRMLICIGSGEVAIRYGFWALRLHQTIGSPIVAAPAVLGVALIAAARFVIEGRYLTLLIDPRHAADFAALDGSDPISAVGRVVAILGFVYLAYPATKIHHGHSRQRTLMDFLIRGFLIVTSGVAGWVLATIYYFHPT